MTNDQKIHVHRLTGCRPTPLAHYLKALGILRLVTSDADPNARGWWQDDIFHLATVLDRESLESFFKNDYAPTAMTGPWLSRSGYSDDSSHSKTRQWLNLILETDSLRFSKFRLCYQSLVTLANKYGCDLSNPETARTPTFINAARTVVPESSREWIDSCIVPTDEGLLGYPAILGTGGNEGSGSYLANYYQAIVVALLFKTSDWKSAAFDKQNAPSSLPGKHRHNAGHFSSSTGMDEPWDYILAMEGTLLLASSLTRILDHATPKKVFGTGAYLSSPFSVSNDCVLYASASKNDSKSNRQGKLMPGRGEQWFPLWMSPSTVREVKQLFRTGRAMLGRRPASRSRDFCLATARLGVNRGISAFERVGYLQRNGDNHMAIPLGRFQVSPRPNQRLLDEAMPWIDRLRKIATDRLAPASMLQAYRSCEQAVFNCARFGRSQDFLDLLIAMGQAENQFLQSPKFSSDRALPIGKLSAHWLSAIAENSCDFRLGVALAAQHGPLDAKTNSDRSRWAPIRSHWLPLDAAGYKFEKGERGINVGPEQSAAGLDLQRAAIAIMHRRFLAMNRGATTDPKSTFKRVPLQLYRPHLGATWEDVAAFLNYETNDAKILAIARAVMAINFGQAEHIPWESSESTSSDGSKSLFGVLRLALPTEKIRLAADAEHEVQCDATVFKRLAAGDVSGAFQLAVRKLSNAGLRPKMSLAFGDPSLGIRLAAAMAFGLNARTSTRLAMTIIADKEESQPRESIAID